jgi:hypothetical protein
MFKRSAKWHIYLVCIIALSFLLIPLEYGTFRFKTIAYCTLWIILGTIIIKAIRNKKYRHRIVLLRIILFFYIAFSFLLLFRSVLCGTGNDIILYTNKKNPSITIVCRTFDCFLTAGPCECYKSRRLIGKLRSVTKFPDFVADKTQWVEYKNF